MNSNCVYCGHFVDWRADSYTPFGCSDPTAPEPYDPSFICVKCIPKDYEKWSNYFQGGSRYGNWCKSKGEVRAAEDYGFIWVGQNSKVDRRNGKEYFNTYAKKEDEEHLVSWLDYQQEKRLLQKIIDKKTAHD